MLPKITTISNGSLQGLSSLTFYLAKQGQVGPNPSGFGRPLPLWVGGPVPPGSRLCRSGVLKSLAASCLLPLTLWVVKVQSLFIPISGSCAFFKYVVSMRGLVNGLSDSGSFSLFPEVVGFLVLLSLA